MLSQVTRPTFFKSPAHFRAWLERHHASVKELWVGFYKKSSGKTGLTYLESVDEAICFGWIDGLKKRYDEQSFMHRFSPRTRSSTWSTINIKRARALQKSGRMVGAGLKAFRERTRAQEGMYLGVRPQETLASEYEQLFKTHSVAWQFFQAQPPGYRRLVTKWIMMAKRPETREKRLQETIEMSAAHRRARWM